MDLRRDRRSILRKGRQIHFEEVDVELPIDVVELVSVLFKRMFLADFLKVLPVVGALVVDTFVDTEAGTVFDRNEDMAAIRHLYLIGLEWILPSMKVVPQTLHWY